MPDPAFRTRWIWLPVVGMVAAYGASHFMTDRTAQTWLQEVLYVAAITSAFIACAMVAREVPRSERRYWLALAAAGAAALVYDLVSAYWDIVLHVPAGPPSPSLADAVSVLVYAFLFIAVFSMTRLIDVPIVTKLRRGLDVSGLVVVLAVGVLILVVRPLAVTANHASPLDDLVAFVYPVLDVGLLAALLLGVFAFKRSQWSPWELLTAAAIVALALSHLEYGFLSATHTYAAGDLASDTSDALSILGFMLFYASAMRRRLEPASPRLPVIDSEQSAGLDWADLIVSLAAPATLTIVLVWAFTTALDPLTHWIAIAAAGALALLAVVRSAVQSIENSRLLSRSFTDPLTGLFNHRFFHERLEAEIGRAGRSFETVSVGLMDLDDFNQVNNVYGHDVGDRHLRRVADRLREGVRLGDTVCRLGGDEFGVIMPATSLMDAFEVCARLRILLGEADESPPSGTGVSIGVAAYPLQAATREDLVRKADGALYWAKYHGRSQVVVYDNEVVNALGPEERIRRIEEQSYTRTVEALAAAVDARDSYTQNHSHSVAALACLLAQKLHLSESRVTLIEVAALLHDVGKIGISDSILRKDSALSEEELAKVREHPVLGERILGETTFGEILPWVLSHHERWDGGGYPQKLAGEEIPLEARILGVCDAYDAMTSDRPYRQALPREAALEEIRSNSGTQFDPQLVDAFLVVLSQTETTEALKHGREKGPGAPKWAAQSTGIGD